MFSLMANCFQWMKKRREPPKKVTLVLIGLDNAGKTTTILGIQGESQEDVAPTVGFSSSQFKFENFDVTVYDLGGGKKIRPIWKNYYAEIHGVVFMMDASDESRLRECQEILQDVLKQEKISGKRILILANKQDKEGALDEIDICDQLNLEDIVTDSKSLCHVETCSALHGIGKKMDSSVTTGLQWLLYGILKDWPTLSTRVAKEMEEQKEAEATEKKAKSERIRKRKEERERKKEEERKRLGLEAPPSEDEDVIIGDPFKAVNKDYFDSKEEQTKQDKAKGSNRALELDKLNSDPVVNNETLDIEQYHEGHSDMEPRISQSAHSATETSRHESMEMHTSGLSEDVIQRDDDRLHQVISENGQQDIAMSQHQSDTVLSQENTENPEKKKKKKKKKLKKKNKLAPFPLDGSLEETNEPITVPSWASTMNQRPLTRPPHQPTLDPLPERASPRLNPIETKTSLNGEREVRIPTRSNLPNLDQDDVIT